MGLAILFSPLLTIGQLIEGHIWAKGIQEKPLHKVKVRVDGSFDAVYSNKEGYFAIPQLNPGAYELIFEHPSFGTKRQYIELQAGDTAYVKQRLQAAMGEIHQKQVSTPRKFEHNTFHQAESVSARDERWLQQMNPYSLAEVLRGLPGIWMQNRSMFDARPQLRGLAPDKNLFVMDGIRLSTMALSSGGSPYLNLIHPSWLGNVEVMRGSGASQYGSNAMGGVIQLHSIDPQYSSQKIEINGQAGFSYQSGSIDRATNAQLRLSTPYMAIVGNWGYRDAGNLMAGRERSIAATGFQLQGGDIKAKFKISSDHQLTVRYQSSRAENLSEYDKQQYQQIFRAESDPIQQMIAYARWESFLSNPWLSKIRFTGSIQQMGDQQNLQTNPNSPLEAADEDIRSVGAQLEIHSKPAPQWNIVSGFEYYHDRLEHGQAVVNPFLNGAEAQNLSLFSIHTLDLLKLRLNVGGRAELRRITTQSGTYGEVDFRPQHVVGNVSASYPLSTNYQMVASFNPGFRLPSLTDMQFVGNPYLDGIGVPNRELGEEKAYTTEIGIKAKTDKYTGSVILYRSRLDELIEKNPGLYRNSPFYLGQPVYILGNTGQALVQGIEAELEVPLLREFMLYGNVNYTYGKQIEQERPLSGIPPIHGKAGLWYQGKKGFWGRAEWHYAAEQNRLGMEDISNPRIPDRASASWNLINFYVGYDVGYNFGWCSASLGIQNVLDEFYRPHGSSLEGYGRALRASLLLRF